MKNFEQQAISRIENNKQLVAYKDMLIGYPWYNQDSHFEWVISASVDEILDWCYTNLLNEEWEGGEIKIGS